jgi:BirA family biotin operon repressor/biotin-[acetyl-CoA-carboxylase] ligase
MNEFIFDEQSIKNELDKERKIYIYDKAGSSNTIARDLCLNGEEEGSIVIVKSQTQGKGRMGRSFLSSSENGLYMSVILRPQIPAEECVNITVLGAVAVLEAIEELTNKQAQIKWVNDIYINDKKCCGILTEASIDVKSGGLNYAIIGIGVNLCPPKGGFDKEIQDIACGVYEDTCPSDFKYKLCAQIVNKLFKYYDSIQSKSYLKQYKEKSYIIGKDVDVYVGNECFVGTAVDIDENANLIVKDKNGVLHTFNSGEARVRRAGTSIT